MADFNTIVEFEKELSKFTGAPYVITTDCCTHAIELCMLYERIRRCRFPAFTYLSIPMLMHKLNIQYEFTDNGPWLGEYKFEYTRIWDSARILKLGMFRQGQLQCISFGFDKPLSIGRGGAVLTDDLDVYNELIKARWDGRDLAISPWEEQLTFSVGYHYRMLPEEAEIGLKKLSTVDQEPKYKQYPDLRKIIIK